MGVFKDVFEIVEQFLLDGGVTWKEPVECISCIVEVVDAMDDAVVCSTCRNSRDVSLLCFRGGSVGDGIIRRGGGLVGRCSEFILIKISLKR